MADAILTNEVRNVLSRAVVSGNVLVLPPEQLERGLYEKVDKALKNAGGKWKRGIGHIFPSDAAPKLAAILGSGVSVDEKKRNQSFFTPSELASHVASIADVRGYNVLEPSAGRGALAIACMNAGARAVDCCEYNLEYVEHLSQSGFAVMHADFLTLPAVDPYPRIVMNPPFTRNQDIAHVRHALKWLKPGGTLVAIMLNNQTRKGFVDLNVEYDPEIEEIERGAFKESGTEISTLIVKIQTEG